MIPPHIFRSYDVRGIYGKDLDENIMRSIGNAFARLAKKDVVVARDVRASGVSLSAAFIHGAVDAGAAVEEIGVVPLGAGMLSAWRTGKEFAYITASHLPKEWNGVKFFHDTGIGYFEQENYAVRDLAAEYVRAPRSGAVVHLSAHALLADYEQFLLGKMAAGRRMKIVLDCGNGCAGLIARRLFTAAGFETVALFEQLDGSFPNRSPEPGEDELAELKRTIARERADFGIAYDGDGDRMLFVDDKGKKVAPEQVACIVLPELLKTEKRDVVANVECTRLIDEIVAQLGSCVRRIPVGHTFLVQVVHELNACFGVETSGHYIIPSVSPTDDALAVSLYVACALSCREEKLSAIVDAIPAYPFERISVECSDGKKFGVVKELQRKFSKEYGQVGTRDGVRVDFDSGWVLVRASNTSPLIRISIEGRTEQDVATLKERFVPMVESEIRAAA